MFAKREHLCSQILVHREDRQYDLRWYGGHPVSRFQVLQSKGIWMLSIFRDRSQKVD
jgi:hypothetical protein